MASPRFQSLGSIALGLSLLTFMIYFANVLIGGPLGNKPWMSDVGEMLTLLVAVILFVAGTLAREEQEQLVKGDAKAGAAKAGQDH